MTAMTFSPTALIDVREPAEFRDAHLPGAYNIPSTSFTIEDFKAFLGRPIHLVCNTGERAERVRKRLEENGFTQVHIHDIQMQAYQESKSIGIEGSWTVDRQFRLILGFLLLISLSGYLLSSSYFLIIAGIICTGLIVTAIIDRCYMKMGIAMLPWNRKK